MRHHDNMDRSPGRSRIAALRNLRGYRVAEGDPDVRGWEVMGGDGRRIGTVNDLLVDTEAGSVRYLDIELDPSLYRDRERAQVPPRDKRPRDPDITGSPELDPLSNGEVVGHAAVPGPVATPSLVGASTLKEFWVRESISDEANELTAGRHLDALHHLGERHVVFPVGHARLDEDRDRVILSSQRAEDAVNLPPYVPGEIHPDYEQALRRWFDPSFTPSAERDLYAHDLYDDQRFYGARRRRASRQITGEEEDRLLGKERGEGYRIEEDVRGDSGVRKDMGVHDEDEASLPIRGRS